jgi:ech hydrogenase subunit A
MDWLLSALMTAPIAFALAAWLLPGRSRAVVVGLSAVVTAGLGLLLGHLVWSGQLAAQWVPTTQVATILEGAILLAILVIAVRIRSKAISLLAVAQLALAGLEQFWGTHATSTEVSFRPDSLATILVLVVSVVGSIIVFYAIGYMKNHREHAPATAASEGRFFLFLVGFLGVMNGLVLANDLKWLSFFWEATTLCSFVLIGHDGTPEAKRNAKRALLINSFGGLAMVAAAATVQFNGGGETLESLTQFAKSDAGKGLMLVPMALLCLAAFTKSAQMPFQSWLLGAMVAPTPVSALLHSATMVKAGSYLVLRIAPAFAGTALSTVVALAGAFTFAIASALAITQSNSKKVLAYSTIANLGLIVTCAGINTPLAYGAALMILCFHAVSKGLLFLCVGTIEQSIGSRDIEDMGGIMWRMPLTTVVTMLGMVSMLVPPFGMLLSKWIAMEASVGSPAVLVLTIAGSAFTVVFWAKWIGRVQTVSYHPKYTIEKLLPSMKWMMLLLAAGVVAGGVGAVEIYKVAIVGLSMAAYHVTSDPLVATARDVMSYSKVWPLFVLPLGALLLTLVHFVRFKPSHVRLTFLCGENLEDAMPRYAFRSIADRGETAWAASYYLRDVVTEGRLTLWSNLLAAVILMAMFGVLRPL